MQQSEVKDIVMNILSKNVIGTLATVKDNKPFSRYMAFYNDHLTLYCATSEDSHKVDDIEHNDNVHILLGYDGEGVGDSYLEMEGKAKVSDSETLKQDLWKDSFSAWLDGPNDPKYAVLEIQPTAIYVKNMNKSDVYELEL